MSCCIHKLDQILSVHACMCIYLHACVHACVHAYICVPASLARDAQSTAKWRGNFPKEVFSKDPASSQASGD